MRILPGSDYHPEVDFSINVEMSNSVSGVRCFPRHCDGDEVMSLSSVHVMTHGATSDSVFLSPCIRCEDIYCLME